MECKKCSLVARMRRPEVGILGLLWAKTRDVPGRVPLTG
jgi:hypothetical protein